jgi:hypothetical protein
MGRSWGIPPAHVEALAEADEAAAGERLDGPEWTAGGPGDLVVCQAVAGCQGQNPPLVVGEFAQGLGGEMGLVGHLGTRGSAPVATTKTTQPNPSDHIPMSTRGERDGAHTDGNPYKAPTAVLGDGSGESRGWFGGTQPI